jgi:serine/threonine protein kinase
VNRDVEPLKPTDPNSFGGWKIKGRLGEGGYSTIFLGEKNEQLAAVKMIRRELLNDSKVFERFATEINNLERINHPGIAKIIESDLSTDVPYIAVEYIEGKTLEQKVEASGPLKEAEWLDCLTQVAAALDYCHKIAITHKDVSPGNIILSQEGPKLIDFGISYHEGDQRVTQLDETVGTPLYMSPEHWDSEPRSEMDIFSLGSTFTFAGSGHSAFIGETKQESRAAIWHVAPNFEGLSKNQINLLTPLLYKNFKDRPNLSELVYATNLLAQNSELTVYETYLKGSDKKLVNEPHYLGLNSASSSKYILPGAILGLLAFGLFLYYLASPNVIQGKPLEVSALSSPTSSVSNSPSSESGTTELDPLKSSSITNSSVTNSSTSRKCEDEFNKKGSDILKVCLPPASSGDLSSIYAVGRYYFEKENYKEAEKWFLLGAKKKDMNNMSALIETYKQVSNTTQRDRWTKICADTNYGTSDYAPLEDLAYCKLMQGSILARAGDIREAILYFTDSADYGNGDAAAWLGVHYRDLDNDVKAKKWLVKSAELGSKLGLEALINYSEKIGDRELTKKWLEISANNGNQVNMGLLALTYYWDKDFVSAEKWSNKGVKFGDVTSTYVLGAVKYDNGQRAEGKTLILSAANKGDVEAIRKLGSIYRIDEKNLPQAAIWYKKLADRNDMYGTSMYSALLFLLGDDKESCVYNDKVLELGDRAKRNGTYNAVEMDTLMVEAKRNFDSWCSKMYPDS